MMAKATLDELVASDAGDADDGAFGFDVNILQLHTGQVELHHPAAGRAVDVGSRREVESMKLFERVVLHDGIVAKWREGLRTKN